MAKIFIEANLDYVAGYLKYGHKEGVVEIPDKDLEDFKKEPIKYLVKHGLDRDMKVVIDDYEIEDYGSITEVNYTIKSGE